MIQYLERVDELHAKYQYFKTLGLLGMRLVDALPLSVSPCGFSILSTDEERSMP
jgi:hypothetical protein